ncbi:MFS transporter [Patescibacteria group bacterium]|nr:MFS transporter [Patescibacteria group bacterium]MDE2021415.1 MFS transporter [Patescibacteria group bacterium]MDE2173014.1 MFS transporter [Patescibacteria group bacterium]
MHPRVVLSVGNFFFSLFATVTVYILLPYLSSFMGEAYTGLVVAGGAFVAVIFFPYLPRLVARYGAQQLALFFALAEMVALFALAAVPGPIAGAFLIAVTVALQPFLSYELDLLLEATVAEEGTTGRVRTLFLTAWNVAALAAPLLMGALLANSNSYGRVFLAAAAALVPFVVLFAARKLPKGETPELSRMRDTFLCIVRDRDLAAVTFAHFLLYLFYVWVALYVPIYLHGVLGIPWAVLGWVFSIMLVPYLLIEYPAGWIADRFIGDKELMLAGFLIAGGALIFIGILSAASSLILILSVLVVSRIGAALIESMTEVHFFRRVSERDINSVSVFRGIWPLADLVAPVAGSLILFFGSYEMLFVLTGGFVTLAGVASTLLIKDFR